jgi:hypothetical protein
MVGVFSIFGTLSQLGVKEAGVGLAAAVLIDATIIRGGPVLRSILIHSCRGRVAHYPRAPGSQQRATRRSRIRGGCPATQPPLGRDRHSANRLRSAQPLIREDKVTETRMRACPRHRRISLLHLAGVPWARIGEYVGQRNFAVTAKPLICS